MRRVHLRVVGFDFCEGVWFHESLRQKGRHVIRRQNVGHDEEGLLRAPLKLLETKVGVEIAFYVPKNDFMNQI